MEKHSRELSEKNSSYISLFSPNFLVDGKSPVTGGEQTEAVETLGNCKPLIYGT
jgi:hypothetical protein